MADHASALIAFRTYPHIDMYERAWQGAELLERAMQGEIRPRTVIARRPMLYGLDWGRTQRGPMAELIARGEALEAGRRGAGRQHLRRVRRSPTSATSGRRSRSRSTSADAAPNGQAIAEEFIDHAWATRDSRRFQLLTVAEAVAALPRRAARRQAAGRRRFHRQSRRRRVWRRDRVPARGWSMPASSASRFTRSAIPKRSPAGCAPGSARRR